MLLVVVFLITGFFTEIEAQQELTDSFTVNRI